MRPHEDVVTDEDGQEDREEEYAINKYKGVPSREVIANGVLSRFEVVSN